MVKKRQRGSRRGSRSSGRKVIASKRKFGLVVSNLILSAILALISWFLYVVTSNEVLRNFFWMLGVIFGFVGLAFLIILAVLFVLKLMKK
ncbi:hypothetical protein HYT25_00145 [Candidatus Pacearchaeota archaeon]|nr:hypothetical protein [Candidatus Pacearchaeota archaeon]